MYHCPEGGRLHDLEPRRRRAGADHDQRHGQRDRDEDERGRDHEQHETAGHEPEQQLGVRRDARHRSGDAAEAAGCHSGDLQHVGRHAEGAEGDRQEAEDHITVKQGKKGVKGVRVKLTGPGIKKTVKTGKNGKVKVTLKPGKPGIIKVVILPKTKVNGKIVKVKACNTQRIGVVGVYEPPVTG